jgi:hypothetical protein
MHWKKFLAVIVNLFLILFPYNIIGCSDPGNPYDYFTSFFDARLGNNSNLKPFYYTYEFLYNRDEPTDQWKATSEDWIKYAGVEISVKEAKDVTGNYSQSILQSIYTTAETGKPSKLPDSVMRNRLVKQFMETKDLEALGYLIFLRKIEPFVQIADEWNPPERDSVKMAAWVKNGASLYNASKKSFFKQRYAYQLTRLSHYSGNYNTALIWYEREAGIKESSSVHELTSALRAGALYRRGDKAQAAYQFCQLFAEGKLKKVSNYYGYHVYTNNIPTGLILGYCKTDKEKANVLATIAMGNPSPDLRSLERISRLSPGDPVLDMLAVREINKLEEKYLSPNIPDGAPYLAYNLYANDDTVTVKNVTETASWLEWMANNKATANPSLYATGAAYLHYISKDFKQARNWLKLASDKGLKGDLADQWRLTELLVTINEQDIINKDFEQKLLPSVQWLEKKAMADRGKGNYGDDGSWTKFYRNLLNSVIGPRYLKQGEVHKVMLTSGAAESISSSSDNGYYRYTLSEIRTSLNAGDAVRLEKLMNDKSANTFEKYLIAHSRFRASDVQDVIGTAFLRIDKLDSALKWFNKISSAYYKEDPYATYLAANPFADLILDTHAPTKQDSVKYTKASFTKKMIALKKQFAEQTDPNKKAITAYELAKGYYQMTYWGNSWLLVNYGWSSSQSDFRMEKEQEWHKEYYSAFRAEQWYNTAFEFSTDKELKAKSLFMLAKCMQKKNMPYYTRNSNYDSYYKELKSYELTLINNPIFRKLKDEYSTSKFYVSAVNTCSYLKDFASGKTKMPGR